MMLYTTSTGACFLVAYSVMLLRPTISMAALVFGSSGLSCFNVCVSMSFLIFPKMYIQLTGKEVNPEARFGVRASDDIPRTVSVLPDENRRHRVWDTVVGLFPKSKIIDEDRAIRGASDSSSNSRSRSPRIAVDDHSIEELMPSALMMTSCNHSAAIGDRVVDFTDAEQTDKERCGSGDVELFAARSAKFVSLSVRSKPGPLIINELDEYSPDI